MAYNFLGGGCKFCSCHRLHRSTEIVWTLRYFLGFCVFCGLILSSPVQNPRPNVPFGTGGELEYQVPETCVLSPSDWRQPGGHCTTGPIGQNYRKKFWNRSGIQLQLRFPWRQFFFEPERKNNPGQCQTKTGDHIRCIMIAQHYPADANANWE